jgi:hypothetical protein
MEVWLRRLFWLTALVIGAGGTVLFVAVVTVRGLPGSRDWFAYLWPATTVAIAIVASRSTRRAWRETPASFAGLLQWRLSDLLLVSFATGCLMAALSSLQPTRVSTFAIPVSLIVGGGLAAGLLIAARMGLTVFQERCMYAVGFSLRTLGIIDIGAFLLAIGIDLIRPLPRVISGMTLALWGLTMAANRIDCILAFVMPGVLFAIGHLLCHLAARLRSEGGGESGV